MPAQRSNSTNIPLNYQQNPNVMDMPNVASAVTTEIQRLQLAIIRDVTNLIEFDYENFQSIDYMPDSSKSDELLPGTEQYNVKFQEIMKNIEEKIKYGQSAELMRQSLEYVTQYRKLFNVTYDAGGKPVLRLSITVNDNVIDDLSISQMSESRT